MKTDPQQPQQVLLDAYPDRLMTATEAMAHLDLTRSAFYDHVRHGVIPRRGDGKFDSGEIRQAYLEHLRAAAEKRGASAGDNLSKERARQASLIADAHAMKNKQRREELLEVSSMVEEYAADLAGLRAALMKIPGRIGPEFAALTPAEAAERVAQLIDEAFIAMREADEVVAKVAAYQMGGSGRA